MMNKRILKSLIGAGLILAAALSLKSLASFDVIDSETSKRVMQVLFGIILMISGNLIPKSDEQCGAAKGQSLRRFAGWTFVIAGLVYATVWLVAPLEIARIISLSVVAASVLLVTVPFAWMILASKRAQPPAEC